MSHWVKPFSCFIEKHNDAELADAVITLIHSGTRCVKRAIESQMKKPFRNDRKGFFVHRGMPGMRRDGN